MKTESQHQNDEDTNFFELGRVVFSGNGAKKQSSLSRMKSTSIPKSRKFRKPGKITSAKPKNKKKFVKIQEAVVIQQHVEQVHGAARTR